MKNRYNTIIVGSGIAGLNLARKLAQAGQTIFIASKEAVTEGSSKYAQGGVAVVSPLNPEDSIENHIEDTIKSGKGLCREEVVKSVLEEGWTRVNELIKLGVDFDSQFNLEGSHSYKRIMHVGDATGRAVMKPLLDNVSRNENVFISQGTEAVSLIKKAKDAEISGVRFSNVNGDEFDIYADAVVLATGGLAALYQDYTCPSILTGDGIALAYDAGAKIENLEFVQFHPTVFKTKDGFNFLISETLRGAGAKLKNIKKENFAEKYHPDAELATRDIVSRAIFSEMKNTDSEFVYLDATGLDSEYLKTKFPNIYAFCLKKGFDLTKDLLPVRPAAHYSIGGIKTDETGRSNVPGLYALGEAASTGLHGANRLASNSLLECIVMAEHLSQAILEDEPKQRLSDSDDEQQLQEFEAQIEKSKTLLEFNTLNDEFYYCSDYFVAVSYKERQSYKECLEQIQQVMTKNLSPERRQKSLQSCIKFLESLEDCREKTTAILVARSALQRKESRGVHFRVDSPRTQKSFERSTILSKDALAKRSPILIKN